MNEETNNEPLTATTLEARATSKELVERGFLSLKTIAQTCKRHPVTVKKVLAENGQEPTRVGRRCFYTKEQAGFVLTHQQFIALP